ncbi:LPS assembly lipoprotein LptE [Saprospiraceae bacterium]|jgi:hypothetical protein|nr:LPS assembly lipoprotein LptE [Bacteroidota bacterium]MDB4727420.1 LPS assembly lipoprotein LptE [Saprospiraceae bacterium]MDF1867082.1 LPS assembly lipoprotein LptE [Saprospiraceae bacterium]
MKSINSPILYCVLFSIGCLLNACVIGGNGYSFKGISIPPEVNTFYIEDFDNQTPTAPPTLSTAFQQELSDKIRNESRLKFDDFNPDIEFKGAISEFRVSAESPQQGQTSAFNRLNISFQIEYVSNLNEEDNWKQRFGHFADFETSQNLIDVQDELIDEILEEIIERIFNKAFTNW